MRDFRVQAIVDICKVFLRREMTKKKLLTYLFFWLRLSNKRPKANKFFDLRDFGYFRKRIIKLGKEDPPWFPRLIEPTTLGLRGWEYSMMFDSINFKGRKVLDVGPGNSRLPQYLTRKGARVTMLDMENPLEPTSNKKGRRLKFVLGDMTKMEFRSSMFDTVICISAIEHVDMKENGFYSEKEYLKRAILALKEMVRVLKTGGDFYLTTEFYLPGQKSDKWIYSDKKIRGAFKFAYLQKFIYTLEESGISLDSIPEIKKEIITEDDKRANFRGRLISTFAFRGIKI